MKLHSIKIAKHKKNPALNFEIKLQFKLILFVQGLCFCFVQRGWEPWSRITGGTQYQGSLPALYTVVVVYINTIKLLSILSSFQTALKQENNSFTLLACKLLILFKHVRNENLKRCLYCIDINANHTKTTVGTRTVNSWLPTKGKKYLLNGSWA